MIPPRYPPCCTRSRSPYRCSAFKSLRSRANTAQQDSASPPDSSPATDSIPRRPAARLPGALHSPCPSLALLPCPITDQHSIDRTQRRSTHPRKSPASQRGSLLHENAVGPHAVLAQSYRFCNRAVSGSLLCKKRTLCVPLEHTDT